MLWDARTAIAFTWGRLVEVRRRELKNIGNTQKRSGRDVCGGQPRYYYRAHNVLEAKSDRERG